MTEAIRQLADELEEHASGRADFRALDAGDRQRVARPLVIARSQANASGKPLGGPEAMWDHQPYRRAMRRKKDAFMYACGAVGIDMREAQTMWWSVVHDSPAPVERRKLI